MQIEIDVRTATGSQAHSATFCQECSHAAHASFHHCYVAEVSCMTIALGRVSQKPESCTSNTSRGDWPHSIQIQALCMSMLCFSRTNILLSLQQFTATSTKRHPKEKRVQLLWTIEGDQHHQSHFRLELWKKQGASSLVGQYIACCWPCTVQCLSHFAEISKLLPHLVSMAQASPIMSTLR